MRLNQILREFLGAREYVAPKDAKTLMADFYMVQMLQQPDVHFPSHLRDEQEYELKQVEATLLPRLKEHLLLAAGNSIFSELQHVYDDYCYIVGLPKHAQRTSKAKLVRSVLPASTIDDLRDTAWRRQSIPEYHAIAQAGLQLFGGSAQGQKIKWLDFYGGKPWAIACEAWLKLYQAQNGTDITLACDRIYDLQHNTGKLLDKNDEYMGDWVEEMLDLKYAQKNPEPLLPFASPFLRQLAQSYMRYFKQHENTSELLGPFRRLLSQLQMIMKPDEFEPGKYALEYQKFGQFYNLATLALLPHGLIKLTHNGFDADSTEPPQRFALSDLDSIMKHLTKLVRIEQADDDEFSDPEMWTNDDGDNHNDDDNDDYNDV